MRDLTTIIRDNKDAMVRHHLGLPLHYLQEKVGTHIELNKKPKPKKLDMEQYAERWSEYCRKRYEASNRGTVQIWPGWRSSPKHEATWRRVCQDKKRRLLPGEKAKVIPFRKI